MRVPALLLPLLATALRAQTPTPRPMFYDPSLSPDRSEIAFVSGGDIWTVPAAGGDARLLVSHPATESRPLFAPDGRRVAFVSTRSGNGDIYVLTLQGGELRRLTYDDQLDQLDGWSPDGRWLYFSNSARDIAGMNDVYRVSVDGGTPMPVSADRFTNEYFSAPAPDGATLALTARGTVSGQWWRRGHSHLDESEIWLLRDADAMRYERVSGGGTKDLWPMWGEDRTLYFVRDTAGTQNVYARGADGAVRRVTSLGPGRVLWPSIAADGRALVFERDFRIWLLELPAGTPREVPVTLRGAPAGAALEHLTFTNQIQELALSPDGQKVAFTVRGEVFAASAREGGDAVRITRTAAREQQVQWSPDSRQLLYVSDREGFPQVFLADVAARTETALTRDPTGDVSPRFSPDGRSVAFHRGAHNLCVVDVASKAVRVLATTEQLDRLPFTTTQPIAWSPDSRLIAWLGVTGRQFSTVYVVPAAGGASRPVSFLADVFANTVSWSPDGTFLLFDTGQRTEGGRLARVDLTPRTPRFRETAFSDLFRPRTAPAPAPAVPAVPPAPTVPTVPPARDARDARDAQTRDSVRNDSASRRTSDVVYDDIRRRLSIIPVGVDVFGQVISPDGKSVVVLANAEGQTNLYTYPLDELAATPVARQLTSTAGGKGDVQWSADGKEVWYLENGRITVATVESRATRTLAVTAELDADLTQDRGAVFAEAWRYLRDNFADSTMHGVAWDSVRTAYAPVVAGARTVDELRRALALMVGELNASHLGVNAPAAAQQPSEGRLGVRFDRAEAERNGRFRVTEVLPLSPAAVAGITTDDWMVSVNGVRLGALVNLDSVLSYTIGRRLAVTVSRRADGSGAREIFVRPVNTATERALRYRAWVEERRAYVARISNGRLGYVHLADMGAGSLQQLYLDLDAENMGREGVVIDIRHNNGGFINAYAIDVFARRGYLTMTYRGGSPATARTVLGQRSLERPTVLVTNQHSLSDAEDFTEGYRTLGLGRVVGEPTSGWIIYTSNVGLVDGTVLRIPFIEIRGADGQVMEMRPRPVDVRVDRPVGESYSSRDSQLDAAVRELLGQIDRR